MNVFLRDIQPERISKLLHTKKSDFWIRAGEKRSLALFHAASSRVLAYKKFLKEQGVRRESIRTYKDFTQLPIVTKDNYLRRYPLEELCWDGTFKNSPIVFTSTSGSTGAPFYFPRDQALDIQSSVFHEMFLRGTSSGTRGTTLVIDCFGMGVWIGGLITYEAFHRIAERGTPLSIITPGINKKEIFDAVREIAPRFDQVIICGYPPFLKDLFDEGSARGIDWKKLPIRCIFAAEAFSERFRAYISEKVGIKDPTRDITNIYGTADLGTMAQETPLAIKIRMAAMKNDQLFHDIFGPTKKTPTLAQFNPLFTNFESVDGDIVCTGYNALPLVRYGLGDRGGMYTFDEMCATGGAIAKSALKKKGSVQLPFVYVYERADFSVKLYGAIIYAEHVREALIGGVVSEWVTGRFSLDTQHDAAENERLDVHIEMKKEVEPHAKIEQEVQAVIHDNLLRRNAEHKNNHSMIPERVVPRIVLWPYEHPDYFRSGGKQKWVITKK